jgi:predicted PurR-regulated permease PerM
MVRSRERGRRITLGLFVLLVFVLLAYIALRFVAAAVFGVFLYYAVRPIFRWLDRFALSRRARAGLALTLFGLPFLFLLLYTVAIVSLEVQALLDETSLVTDVVTQITSRLGLSGLDLGALEGNLDTVRQFVGGAGAQFVFGATLTNLSGVLSTVGSVLVQLLVVVLSAYYMLVDGPRFVDWALSRYDDSGVLAEYVEAVDPELSDTLFGNIVNIFVTAILAVATFYTYNLLAPGTVDVPYPILAGALAGIASLIPAVGIKIVYIPIAIGLALNAILAGDVALLVWVGALAAVSAVLVDFVPDIVVRAQISGEDTHTGLLMLSYLAGPTAFGFYGLFLAPILLVLAINAVDTIVPYVLAGERADARQTSFGQFEDTVDATTAGERPDGEE